jgi:predicted phosphodiesterase
VTHKGVHLSRRALLRGSTLLLGSGWAHGMPDFDPALRFAMLTDVHHADKPERGTRYYRESLSKLKECATVFRESNPAFLIQLGDLVDAASDLDTERQWLREAVGALKAGGAELFSVLGNHCIQTLTKAQFLKDVERGAGHYSFDRAGFRFITLDACYRKDGVSYDAGNFDWKDTDIPPAQRRWLEQQLKTAAGHAVVFVHQRLDTEGVHSVASAAAVRQVLEQSRKVLAVFQGHSHQNDYREVNGIHYCTMRAVIEGSGAENNGYSIVSIYKDGRLAVNGFRAQRSYDVR